jgi:hypothetical protein
MTRTCHKGGGLAWHGGSRSFSYPGRLSLRLSSSSLARRQASSLFDSSGADCCVASRCCRLVAVRLTPKALTLLVHGTASVVLPNVRANLRAEADDDWPRKA